MPQKIALRGPTFRQDLKPVLRPAFSAEGDRGVAAEDGRSAVATGEKARRLAARRWFGYGRWDAPYWFIGLEQGGEDGPEHASYTAWANLGGGELIDCRTHHLAVQYPGFDRWHAGERPPTQKTWRHLIQLLLGYLRQPADLETVRSYQRDLWGCTHGETAVLELSALRAQSVRVKVERQLFRSERIQTIRSRMDESRPNFVICYGLGYREDFETLLETRFDVDGYAYRKDTLAVLLRHPARETGSWEGKGQEIRQRVRSANCPHPN